MTTTFETIEAALPLSEIAARMRAEGFTDADIVIGRDDYKRLLMLISETGQTLRPTKLADEVLHRHLAMARFETDCESIIGFPIDHIPHGEETSEISALGAKTTSLWLKRFGFKPGASNYNHIGAGGLAYCAVARKTQAETEGAFAYCAVARKTEVEDKAA